MQFTQFWPTIYETNEFLMSVSWVGGKVGNMKLLNRGQVTVWNLNFILGLWECIVGVYWVCGSMKWKCKYGILETARLSEYENSADFRGYFSLSNLYSS